MQDPDHIECWRRLDDRITTSAQPSESQLAEIKALGVAHVINLGMRDHPKALANEGASVAALDMEYTHIPVQFDDPTEQDFRLFCAALAGAADKKIHVHCIANWRVSAFFYVYQRDVLGLDDQAARAMMDSIWKPGGVWAQFIGDETRIAAPHEAV